MNIVTDSVFDSSDSLECEQSLLCSKIRGEERKEEVSGRERASVICEALTCVLNSLRSSPRIFEQERDCSLSCNSSLSVVISSLSLTLMWLQFFQVCSLLAVHIS